MSHPERETDFNLSSRRQPAAGKTNQQQRKSSVCGQRT
jgi:hypothetical protein